MPSEWRKTQEGYEGPGGATITRELRRGGTNRLGKRFVLRCDTASGIPMEVPCMTLRAAQKLHPRVVADERSPQELAVHRLFHRGADYCPAHWPKAHLCDCGARHEHEEVPT